MQTQAVGQENTFTGTGHHDSAAVRISGRQPDNISSQISNVPHNKVDPGDENAFEEVMLSSPDKQVHSSSHTSHLSPGTFPACCLLFASMLVETALENFAESTIGSVQIAMWRTLAMLSGSKGRYRGSKASLCAQLLLMKRNKRIWKRYGFHLPVHSINAYVPKSGDTG